MSDAVERTHCPRCGTEEIDSGAAGFYCPKAGCLPEAEAFDAKPVSVYELGSFGESDEDGVRLTPDEWQRVRATAHHLRVAEFERDIAWHDGPPEEVAAVVAERDALKARVAELERKLIAQREAAKEAHREACAQAVAAEREACAKLAESFIDGGLYQAARTRDAIRARGGQ